MNEIEIDDANEKYIEKNYKDLDLTVNEQGQRIVIDRQFLDIINKMLDNVPNEKIRAQVIKHANDPTSLGEMFEELLEMEYLFRVGNLVRDACSDD